MNLEALKNELIITMSSIAYVPKLSEADHITSIVATALHLHVDDIKSNSRATDLVEARQIISKLLYDRDFVYREIGHLFHRDHSTVVISIRKYHDKVDIKDKSFLKKVALVTAELEALCV